MQQWAGMSHCGCHAITLSIFCFPFPNIKKVWTLCKTSITIKIKTMKIVVVKHVLHMAFLPLIIKCVNRRCLQAKVSQSATGQMYSGGRSFRKLDAFVK